MLIFQRIIWRFSSSTSSMATWLPTTLTLVPALIVDCSSWSHALSAHRQLAAGPVCQHYPRLYDPIYRTVKAMKICMYSCTMEKMRPNRSKFDRQAPTEKAVVGNFTEKQKGRARDVNSSDTCKTQHKHGTPTPASRLHGSTIRTCIHVCAWATYTRTDLLLFAY